MKKHLQRFGNLVVVGLLRSPLHRLASDSLLLITYRGRRSGRSFTIPVMYAEHEGTLTIFVGHSERKMWWRNLRAGAQVEVRLRGHRQRGHAEVVQGSAAVATYLGRYPRARTAIEATDSPTFVRIGTPASLSSVAQTRALSARSATATATAPEPVPTSATRTDREPIHSTAQSTSASVVCRGVITTPGAVRIVTPSKTTSARR